MKDNLVESARRLEDKMETGDFPPMYDRPIRVETTVEARPTTATFSVDALNLLASDSRSTRERLIAERLQGANKMDLDVSNVGAVEKLTLPAGWVTGKEVSGIGGLGRSQQYLAPGCTDVELTFFDRGRRYNSNAKAFNDVLTKPAHTLSAEEQKSLGSILGNYEDARAFKIESCKTEDLNGKRVLVIDGVWNVNGHRSHSILVSPDGTGSTVQEVFFKAPPADYTKNLTAVLAALKTVRWK